MAIDFRQFDEHGFPLPPRFDDLKFRDDELRQRPQITIRTKRVVLLVLLLGIVVPVIFGPQIISAGRAAVVHWFTSRAEQKYLDGDYTGAIADVNWAIGWSQHARDLYFLRALCREKVDDLNGSLADWNQAIGLTTVSVELAEFHASRSWVYVRLSRYPDAIDDATQAVRLSPTAENLNSRAYVRALANMELSDGLADINKAMTETGENNAEFLDTRGYLLHLLDQNEDALKDLTRAVKLTEETKMMLQMRQRFRDHRELLLKLREINHGLAVMYHHRGLVNDKLGHKEDADQDLRHGDQLGYNPAQGVM
jgi:tetratricopeptide (TPR) repeat protein